LIAGTIMYGMAGFLLARLVGFIADRTKSFFC
jgi:hypothetical protein